MTLLADAPGCMVDHTATNAGVWEPIGESTIMVYGT
jgi:hypothetical protein